MLRVATEEKTDIKVDEVLSQISVNRLANIADSLRLGRQNCPP